MRKIILFSIIVLCCVISFALISSARPTSGTIPAAKDSKDSVYNTNIITEVFIDIADYTKIQNGTSDIEKISPSKLKIDAGTSDDHAKAIGRNSLQSKTIYYDMNYRYGTHPVYTIETMIYPSAANCNWMRVIYNGDVCVYISTSNGNPCLYAFNSTTGNFITYLSTSSAAIIYLEAFEDTYDIYVDTDGDGEPDVEKKNINNSAQDPQISFFVFGDRGSPAYGYLEWEYFNLKGHVSNEVKYFENFDDGNAENLFFRSEKPDDTVNPGGMYLYDWGDSSLENYCLEFLGPFQEKKTWAQTPWIDFVRDSDYTISLEFEIRNDSHIHWFIILSDRNNIVLYLKRLNTPGPTKLYSYDGSSHEIMIIDEQIRYYLEVSRSGDEYTVEVDLVPKGTYDIQYAQSQTRLRFGDFSNDDCFDRVRIDNVMLRQNKSAGTDSDSDKLTDDFESEPYCPIFIDDFEYDLPVKEYGWQSVVKNGPNNHEEIWEVGYPDDGTEDPDYGIAYGLVNDLDPIEERSRILGTDIGGAYPNNMWVDLKSPIIELPDGGGGPSSYFTIKIFTWMWWEFENDVDGGIVRIEYWEVIGDPPHGVGTMNLTPNGGYPNAEVSCFDNTSAFSGSSGKWVEKTFEVQSCLLKGQFIRLVFETRSDNQNDSWGWYIDDVKIYISMITNAGPGTGSNDEDGDTLLDGQEFYNHGTSPMHHDSDFDGIFDGIEVGPNCAWGEEFGGDPQVRNIFLEVDWLTNASYWDHEPPVETFEDMRESFEDHDIWFYWDLDDEIAGNWTNEYLTMTEFFWWFAYPGTSNSDTRFTWDRRDAWHYCLFAHHNDTVSGLLGKGYLSYTSFVIYQGNCELIPAYDDDWLPHLVSHELGHNLGLFDYNSTDNYHGASPPQSTMDYAQAYDANPQPDYLGEESDDYFNCLVAGRKVQFKWDNNPWRYGGWQFSYVGDWEYRVNTIDGKYIGGLYFRSVRHGPW